MGTWGAQLGTPYAGFKASSVVHTQVLSSEKEYLDRVPFSRAAPRRGNVGFREGKTEQWFVPLLSSGVNTVEVLLLLNLL